MKNLIFALIFGTFAFAMNAQVNVTEGSKSMVEGTYNAYTVTLPDVEEDEAEDMWKDFMKEYKAKVKKDKKAKIHFSDNVQMPTISANPVDVYASIFEVKGKSTTVSVWFDTGSGYVNTIDMEAQSDIAYDIVTEYGTRVMKKHSENIQENEEKSLKNLINDAKKLEDKNKDLRDDIAKAKENILKWEKELDQNEDDIKKKAKDIDKQEMIVTEAKENTRKY